MTSAEENVERLRRLDSCAVSDAGDRLQLSGRVVSGLLPLTGQTRIAGRVITIQLGPPDRDGPTAARHLGAAATDAATAIDVIVIAHQGRMDCAGWGGNLSRGAVARGCAGTLIDGATRDVDEAIEIGYPIFAAGATPVTARSRAEEKAWSKPINFCGIAVTHGDYVVADSTGIVFVAEADIDLVLDAAETIATKEAAMADDIDAGKPVSEVMGADYERMLN